MTASKESRRVAAKGASSAYDMLYVWANIPTYDVCEPAIVLSCQPTILGGLPLMALLASSCTRAPMA
eukprot:scaffold19795_cov126-Isochrysis_galbana.AAC.3